MSVRRALTSVWRNLVEGKPLNSPRYDEGWNQGIEAQKRTVLQAHAEALTQTILPRVPDHLRDALEHVVLRSTTPPADQLSLMNQLSSWRTGLGIANERGGVPSAADQLLYEQLGELERWMDKDLGHPENTQYAVVRRATERLQRSDEESTA